MKRYTRPHVPRNGGGSSRMGLASGASFIGLRSLSFGRAQHVGEDPICAGSAGGQLAEPTIGGENISALTVLCVKHSTGHRLFAGIVRFQNALIFRVPFGGE